MPSSFNMHMFIFGKVGSARDEFGSIVSISEIMFRSVSLRCISKKFVLPKVWSVSLPCVVSAPDLPDVAKDYTCVVDLTCTFVAWLKALDPSHQELISVFISWNIERRRLDTEIRVRTPRNRTSWYRLLDRAIIMLRSERKKTKIRKGFEKEVNKHTNTGKSATSACYATTNFVGGYGHGDDTVELADSHRCRCCLSLSLLCSCGCVSLWLWLWLWQWWSCCVYGVVCAVIR